MCCKLCQNIFKVFVIIFFIITIGYYLKIENNLGASFSFVLIIFFTLHLFETNIKIFRLGNLEIELQKSIKFNKMIGLKTAEIILFLLNNAIGVYQSKEAVKNNRETINNSKQEIIKMLCDFEYTATEIQQLKDKYFKE